MPFKLELNKATNLSPYFYKLSYYDNEEKTQKSDLTPKSIDKGLQHYLLLSKNFFKPLKKNIQQSFMLILISGFSLFIMTVLLAPSFLLYVTMTFLTSWFALHFGKTLFFNNLYKNNPPLFNEPRHLNKHQRIFQASVIKKASESGITEEDLNVFNAFVLNITKDFPLRASPPHSSEFIKDNNDFSFLNPENLMLMLQEIQEDSFNRSLMNNTTNKTLALLHLLLLSMMYNSRYTQERQRLLMTTQWLSPPRSRQDLLGEQSLLTTSIPFVLGSKNESKTPLSAHP